MAPSENSLVSERSQACILRKQGFKVSQIMELLNKSKNWVMKWYVHGKTGEFSRRKVSDRPSKLSKVQMTGNDVMIDCISCHHDVTSC